MDLAQRRRLKWDLYFLKIAQQVASASKDPSTQTGAVIVDPDNRLVSTGYNGLPRGVRDTPERLNHRETKYKIIIHCERNAIIFARQNLQGCTIYNWPMMPCATCAAMIIQAGIVRSVSPPSNNPRWLADFALTRELFSEVNIVHDDVGKPVSLRRETHVGHYNLVGRYLFVNSPTPDNLSHIFLCNQGENHRLCDDQEITGKCLYGSITTHPCMACYNKVPPDLRVDPVSK